MTDLALHFFSLCYCFETVLFQAHWLSVSCYLAENFSAVTQPFRKRRILVKITDFGGQARLMEAFCDTGDLQWGPLDFVTITLTRIWFSGCLETARKIRCTLCLRFDTTSAVDFRQILELLVFEAFSGLRWTCEVDAIRWVSRRDVHVTFEPVLDRIRRLWPKIDTIFSRHWKTRVQRHLYLYNLICFDLF